MELGSPEWRRSNANQFQGMTLPIRRVSEWLAASLEMRCRETGCEFDSRALRFRELQEFKGFGKSLSEALFCFLPSDSPGLGKGVGEYDFQSSSATSKARNVAGGQTSGSWLTHAPMGGRVPAKCSMEIRIGGGNHANRGSDCARGSSFHRARWPRLANGMIPRELTRSMRNW